MGLLSCPSTRSVRAFASLVLALSGLTGCVRQVAPGRCPKEGGNPWYQAVTAHFVVTTDLEEQKVRPAVSELERGYAELSAAAFPKGAGNADRLAIVIVRDDLEMAQHFPSYGGFSTERLYGTLEYEPTLVFPGPRYSAYESYVRSTFLHELTHRFIAYNYGAVPMWVNEGLAEYYSSLRIDGDKLVLRGGVGVSVGSAVSPSIAELLDSNRETFYAEKQKVELLRDDSRRRYYAGAWALVHFLLNGEDARRKRFSHFVTELGEGKSQTVAWNETVGTEAPDALQSSFDTYLKRYDWDTLVFPAPHLSVSPIESVRTLSDAESDLVWARIQATSKDERSLALLAFDRAIAHDHDAPEVVYRRASYLVSIGQIDEAIEELRRATSLGTARDRCRASYGLARALGRKREDGPLSASQVSLEAASVANLAECAQTVSELTLAAEIFTKQGDLERALKAADRAIARDPAYRFAYGARGDVHARAGRLELAIADYERGVALVPDGADPRAFTTALAKARFDLALQRGKKRTE